MGKNSLELHFKGTESREDLCSMLRQMRRDQNMTQKELAKRVGMSQAMIAKIETGNNGCIPRVETISKLASALGFNLKMRLR